MKTWFLLIVFALFSFASASLSLDVAAKEKVSFKTDKMVDSLAVTIEQNDVGVLKLIFDSGGAHIERISNKGTYGISSVSTLDFRQMGYKESIRLIKAKLSNCSHTIVHPA